MAPLSSRPRTAARGNASSAGGLWPRALPALLFSGFVLCKPLGETPVSLHGVHSHFPPARQLRRHPLRVPSPCSPLGSAVSGPCVLL